MKKARSGLFRGRLLATSALVACAVLASGAARAGGPSGGSVVVGTASISTPSASQTVVNQASKKALIDWNSFSIPNGSSVVFNQPTASSLTVNRVTGPSASVIDGQMLANGNIWLLNSNGVLFGHGAQINVGGLLATTSDLTDDDFRKGSYRFTKPSSNSSAGVVNKGTITAAKGGSVVLSAPQVSNEGLIKADLGSVVLGGARTFTVDFDGDNLIRYRVGQPVAETSEDAAGAQVSNSGKISADGGSVLMTARTARAIESNVINNTGIVEASSVSSRNGEIVLDAGPDGTVNAGGSITASGHGQTDTGGSVAIAGGTVNVADGATIDASGTRGGGTVEIGGGLHGQGGIANAQETNVGKAAISANAGAQGDGGKISIWSGGKTAFNGQASAKGGSQGGNGGIVETSGEKLNIGAGAKVDTSASNGNTGTWLLDPTDIDIVNGGSDGLGGSNIDPTTISDALATSNVSLAATNDITLSNGITYSSANSFSMTAGRDMALNGTIQNMGSGSVYLTAHSISRSGNGFVRAALADITLTGARSNGASIGTATEPLQISVQNLAVHTGGADAFFTSFNSPLSFSASDVGIGNLIVTSSGPVSQTGAIRAGALSIATPNGPVTLTNAGNSFSTLSLSVTNGSASIYDASNLTVTGASTSGNLTLSGGGSIDQTGAIHADALSVSSTGGAIDLTNAGNDFSSAALATSGSYDAALHDASALSVTSANVGGVLTLSSGGAIGQTGAIHAAGLNLTTTNGAIDLSNAGNSFATLTLSTPGTDDATLYDTSALTVNAATAGGDLTLTAASISQTGALHAHGLSVTTTSGSISLTNTANTFDTLTATTGGANDASFADASALQVAGANIGGALTLSGAGSIGQTGAIHAAALNVTTASGAIALNNLNNNFTAASLATAGTDNASLYDSVGLTMTGADVGGDLALTGGGSIGQSGAIHANDLSVTANGAVSLSNTGNSFDTATLNAAGDASLHDASALTIVSAVVDGAFTLSGDAAIGQSGAIVADALNVSSTGGAITLTDSGNAFGTASVTTAASYDASLYDTLNLTVTGANAGGMLTLTGGGSIGQSGAISAAGIDVTTTNGAIDLDNAGNAFATAALSTSGADSATLYDASGLTIASASIGGTLNLTGGDSIGQTGAIHASTLNVQTAGGGITLTNAANSFASASLVTAGTNDASLYDAANLIVTSAAVGGTLNLSGGGTIGQSGAIQANALNVTASGAVVLTNAGNAFAQASLSTSDDATLYDASDLTVTGAAVTGALTLSGGGSIGQSGAFHADTLSVATANGAIVLTNAGNTFNTATLATAGADDASLYDASGMTIAGANVGGDLTLSSGGSIGQTGAIHAAALAVSATGGAIALSNAGNSFAAATISTSGADDATLYDASNLTVAGAAVGGTLTLSGGGTIGQSGAIHAGALNVTTTNGAIALTNAGNGFATLTLSTSGDDDASVYDSSNLIVAGATIGGDFSLSGGGAIGQTGAIVADAFNVSATGGDISLANTGNAFATASLSTAGTDNAALYDAVDLSVTGADVGGTLTLTGGGSIGQTGAIHSAALNVTATGGDIALTDSGNSFATASLTTAGTDNASLYDAADLILSSADVGGTLTLSGGGTVGQTGALHTANLNVSASGAIVLTNTGNSFATATVSTGADATIYDGSALAVASADVDGVLTMTAQGPLSQSGAIHTHKLVVSSDGDIVLADPGNTFDILSVTAPGTADATLHDSIALTVSDASVGGVLTLSSGGAMDQSGAIVAHGLNASATSGDIVLTNGANSFDLASLQTSGANGASLYDSSNLTMNGANIGGTLDLSGGGGIGQSGALYSGTLNVSTTGGAISLLNSGNSFHTASLETAGAFDASLYDAVDLVISGASVGGGLVLSGGGSIGQTGAIQAASLDVTATGGGIALTNSGNAFGTVKVSTSGADDASIHDASDLVVSSANVGGTFTLTGGGTIGQSGAIEANTLNVSTASGAISLTGEGNAFHTLIVSTGGTDNASIHDSIAMSIANASIGGALTVSSDGSLTQTGAIHAGSLDAGTTGGDIVLTDADNRFAAATLAATGDASLHDASALTVAGATAGGTLTLSGDAGIGQSGAIDAHVLNASTTSGAIVLTDAGNIFDIVSLSTSGADGASVHDGTAMTVAAAAIGGGLTLSGTGSIAQTGAIHADNLNVTSSGGAISLTNAGNAFNTATLSTTGEYDAELHDASALTIAGATIGGDLALTGGASIGQTGAIHASTLDVSTPGGDISLSDAGNAFATVTVAGADNASIHDSTSLTVTSATVGGTLTLSGDEAIAQSGAIHAAALDVSTAGGAIVLTNSGNAFDTASIATSGSDNASLYDASDLIVTSANVGGRLTLSGGGSIGQSDAISAQALDVTAQGDVALTDTGNSFGTVTLSATGNASLYDASAMTVASAAVGGGLTLSGAGAIGQTGAIEAATLNVSTTSGAIALSNTGNTFGAVTVATNGSDNAAIYDTPALNVASANVGGTLALSSGSTIGQTGAIHAGSLSATATHGAIDLNNTGNSFASATLATGAADNASLYDASALIVDSANIGGTLTLSGAGAIGQTGAIQAAALNVTTTAGQISLTSADNAFDSATLSTPESAWLYDGSALTLNDANTGGSLTPLSKHDLTFVTSVQAKTGLLAVAGWDGATTDPASLVAGTAYANNGGSIVIGGANAAGDVAVGSLGGTTTLAGSNVSLAATNGYAQLGYHGAGTGAVSVYAKGDLTLSGGANAGRFAQIGNGGYLVSGNESGDIYISAAGNLALNGGAGNVAYAQIGHGGAQSNSSSNGYSDTGLITVNAKTATVAAGTGIGSYAQIGHGGYLSGQSLLGGTVTLGGNIAVTTVSGIALTGNGTAGYAQIGHGGDLVNSSAANGTAGTITGDITATVSTKPADPSVDPVRVIAGSGDESYAQIGNGGSGENTPVEGATVHFTVGGKLFVDDIVLRGSDTGALGYAAIGGGDAGRTGTADVFGDITIGLGFSVDALDGSADGAAAMIGGATGFGTVTGSVTFLSAPPPPPPPPPPPTVGSSGGALAVVIQRPTESIGGIATLPGVGIPDITVTDTGSGGNGPGPLEQLVDSSSGGKSSEKEQPSDSATESLGKSLDAGRRSASRELMPGLVRNMAQHPHAVPPADVDYSSWGNEAFWVW